VSVFDISHALVAAFVGFTDPFTGLFHITRTPLEKHKNNPGMSHDPINDLVSLMFIILHNCNNYSRTAIVIPLSPNLEYR
jgi:hypothetical protein